MNGYLLIRVNGDPYGLPINEVVEVVDDAKTEPVPGAQQAVRGIARIRGRTVPVVNLGSLLTECVPPPDHPRTVVVARCGDRRVAFEVDDADAVVREEPIRVPAEIHFPWVSGVAQHQDNLIPVLDMDRVGERLVTPSGEPAP